MKLSPYNTDPLFKKVLLNQNYSDQKIFDTDFALELNYPDESVQDDEPDFDCEFL
ncbi:hypothetical protein [Flavobacterium limi]|uniref:Uncharacterized protein n=1 Tax=Flavobacterium limi TaxID=2045105 RepID=A0ABQ1UXE1_9FLAO|nr:hypothetical protein [Flavobacterium limi]GGF29477.1 hypothetical protein GCM10011518_43430 [Flavobacterium limi]